jgi:hypothetical protein
MEGKGTERPTFGYFLVGLFSSFFLAESGDDSDWKVISVTGSRFRWVALCGLVVVSLPCFGFVFLFFFFFCFIFFFVSLILPSCFKTMCLLSRRDLVLRRKRRSGKGRRKTGCDLFLLFLSSCLL